MGLDVQAVASHCGKDDGRNDAPRFRTPVQSRLLPANLLLLSRP